ncbi:MAG: hypothetical protein CMK59_01805 [Proteobacteria bacterium]|nr:hypothetical protein [Pseudomonadota bacterium]
MSKGYYITIKESICAPVQIEAEDKLEQRIKLKAILPKSEMKELLKEALLDLGFLEEEELLVRLDESGELQIVDLEKMILTAKINRSETEMRELSEQKQITLEKRVQQEQIKQQLKERLQEQVDNLTTEHSARLQLEIAATLAENTPQRNELIHTALQKTYAEALKRKAQSLGQVLEQSENISEDGQYELNIKIEL